MKRNVLLLICSILIALLFGELVVRGLHLAPYLISLNIDSKKSAFKSSSNPILGYEFKPNYRDYNLNINSRNFNFPETNSHGQRDKERTYSKAPETRRIILLGDSVVAGYGLWNLDNTISRQMELLLTEKAHIEVLNFGVEGYQTLAESELLKTKGVKYVPDLVILVFEDSDFEPLNFRIKDYDPQLNVMLKLLFKKSHLFRFVTLKFDIDHLRFRTDMNYRINCHAEALSNSVETGIVRIHQLSHKYGFEFFIVIWPRFSNASPQKPIIRDFCPSPGQYDRLLLIESICKKYGLDSYRLADFFIKDYTKISDTKSPQGKLSLNETYTIGDTCHPNEYGSGVAALAILELLETRKFINNVREQLKSLPFGEKNADSKKVIEYLNEAIRLKPNDEAYNNRGLVYYKLGQYREALADYNEAIRLNPDVADVYSNRGTIYFKLGQYQQALVDYNKAIIMKPKSADAYNNRGLAYGKLGQYQQAVDDFNQATSLKPDYIDAYNNRGFAYFLQGNKERGCSDAQKACSLGMCKLFEFANDQGLCK